MTIRGDVLVRNMMVTSLISWKISTKLYCNIGVYSVEECVEMSC